MYIIVTDEAECELNCKPIGLNYYAMLNERVIDGTSCIRPIESIRVKYTGPAKCVEGVCKVRCDFLVFILKGILSNVKIALFPNSTCNIIS